MKSRFLSKDDLQYPNPSYGVMAFRTIGYSNIDNKPHFVQGVGRLQPNPNPNQPEPTRPEPQPEPDTNPTC